MTPNEAIEVTARDYYEGWYDGDASRMERALHPSLAKRALTADGIDELSAQQMIDGSEQGIGKRDDPEERRIDITVDHVHGTIATAHVTGPIFTDYLQLVEIDGRWRILNALWART